MYKKSKPVGEDLVLKFIPPLFSWLSPRNHASIILFLKWGTSRPTQTRESSTPWTIVVLLLKCMFSNSVMLLHFSVSPFLLSRWSSITLLKLTCGYGNVRTKWPQGQWVGPCAAGHLRAEVVQRRSNTEFHYTDPSDDLDSTMVLFYKGIELNSDITQCCGKQETITQVGTNLHLWLDK